jgi:hypothetical protein
MRSLALAIASLLFITFTVNAQDNIRKSPTSKYAKQLCWEFGGDISFTSTSIHEEQSGTYSNTYDETENIFLIEGNAGIFIVNGLKLGIEPGVAVSSYNGEHGSSTTTHLALYFSPEYVFNTKSIVYPYIGGAIGYSSNIYSDNEYNPTEDGFSYGARAGLKVNFIGNSLLDFGFVFYSENYHSIYDYQYYHIDRKERNDRVGLTLGWSVFF